MSNPLSIRFTPEVEPGADVLQLRGPATFREAPELRRRLFDALGRRDEGRLVVELAEVERMDTIAMAVLVEGLLATRQSARELYFCSPSSSVESVFELSGLDEALSRCYGCLGDVLEGPACGCKG